MTPSLTAGALLLTLSAQAVEPDYAALSAELVELRRTVEAEEDAVSALRSRQESERRALEEQRTELSILRQREALRRDAADERAEQLLAQQGELDESVAALAPILDRSLAELEAWTRAGLPYRADERAEVLAELREELATGVVDPRTATSRLWQHVEDELVLTQSAGVSRQVVALGGEHVLARVAHLGLVAAFFDVEDSRYGRAVAGPGGWSWVELAGPERGAAADLVGALTRSVRSGAFRLPLAPPGEGA